MPIKKSAPNPFIVPRIETLAASQKKSLRQVEMEANLSPNSIYKLKTQTPGVDKIEKIANVLNTSVDYLLGRTDNKYALSEKEEKDVGELTEALLSGLNSDASVNFYGEPMTDSDKAELRGVIQAAVIMNKENAKRKALNNQKHRGE